MVEEGGGAQSHWWEGAGSVSWLGPTHDPDRYRVLETASAGAEGSVLRGELILDGNPIPVAIKVLHDNQEDLEEWERRWNRQTEILRTVQHPSLVTVREAFVGARAHQYGAGDATSDALYLVMNWASGETLDAWARGRPTMEVVPVLGSLADAIDYLHRGEGSNGIGVIHRDIKPANVIVDDGVPILVDFGFARFVRSTDETVVVYSRSFAAPEVMRGEIPDASADRFAFAATALRVLTGLTAAKCSVDEISGALQRAGLRSDLREHLLASLDVEPSRRPVDLSTWHRDPPSAPDPEAPSRLEPVPVVQMVPASVDPVPAGTLMRAAVANADQPARAQPAPVSSRSNAPRIITALVLALVALVAVGIGVWLWFLSGQAEVVVPDMVGSTKESGSGMLDGLPVSALLEPVESTAEPGTIVSVSPPAGSVVDPGTEIIVEYASASFTMPDLTGRTADDAIQEITARGIAEERVELTPVVEVDASLWCTVTAQTQRAKESVDRSSPVELVVAVASGKSPESCTSRGG